MLETCDFCGIDTVKWECNIELSSPIKVKGDFWRGLFDKDEIRYLTERICDLCYLFLRQKEAKVLRAVKTHPRNTTLEELVGKENEERILKELMTYGISWYEAADLDHWFVSEFFRREKWPRLPDLRWLLFDYKFSEVYEKASNEVLYEKLQNFYEALFNEIVKKPQRLFSLWEQLSYVFTKYSERYKEGYPHGWNPKEWNKLVDEVASMFVNSYPTEFEKNLKTLSKFIKNLHHFWW